MDVKAHILEQAGSIVSGARRAAYGTPENNFQRIARFWQAYFLNTGREVEILPADVSPMMRLMKEARLCESPGHLDSFVDIVGYALTGAEVNGVAPAADASEPKLADVVEEAKRLAAAAPETPWYPEGGEWTEHDGGPMPVPGGTVVDVLFRSERKRRIATNCPRSARLHTWDWCRCALSDAEIVAYKIVKGDGQ